jgi:ribonuclease HII
MTDIEQQFISQGYKFVIGIDEAGRGPLAGPVVAAAVALQNNHFQSKIGDSKSLSPREREQAFHEIYRKAYVGVGIMNETVIDRENILKATFLAMDNAVMKIVWQLTGLSAKARLDGRQFCLLIDGNSFKSGLPYDFRTVVQGDKKVLSIMCASIVAKVARDRILQIYHRILPQYGFDKHKGYPTPAHKQAIKNFGLSFIHRRTFHFQP